MTLVHAPNRRLLLPGQLTQSSGAALSLSLGDQNPEQQVNGNPGEPDADYRSNHVGDAHDRRVPPEVASESTADASDLSVTA